MYKFQFVFLCEKVEDRRCWCILVHYAGEFCTKRCRIDTKTIYYNAERGICLDSIEFSLESTSLRRQSYSGSDAIAARLLSPLMLMVKWELFRMLSPKNRSIPDTFEIVPSGNFSLMS